VRALHWFRNDLRLVDNTTIAALADRAAEWSPVFVIDPRFVGDTPGGPRVRFLMDCLRRLRADLADRGVTLCIRQGRPEQVLPALMEQSGARLLSFGEADTPLGRRRDEAVLRRIERQGAEALVVRDHTVFGPDEILTRQGGHYAVFTPYRNAWWARWQEAPRRAQRRSRLPAASFVLSDGSGRSSRDPLDAFAGADGPTLPTGGERAARRRLERFLEDAVARYATDRDRPDRDGTSRLSPHLRFGTISVRTCFDRALAHAEAVPAAAEGVRKWLDELVWREFYAMILATAPHVLTRNHRPEYDALQWSDSDAAFEAWRDGRTGYPIVDAGMRQLRETGWMHNRVRMIVASFLTKDLLIDWRRGARYFFEALVDGDPASNSGGWQWAASTGTDAQPYFRIFNPVSQGEKCDPEGAYVRRWVPELRELDRRFLHAPWKAPEPPADYPAPIVDHAVQRERALEAYRRARATAG
jgi:deoxyribodipyrimidine photo-lyase